MQLKLIHSIKSMLVWCHTSFMNMSLHVIVCAQIGAFFLQLCCITSIMIHILQTRVMSCPLRSSCWTPAFTTPTWKTSPQWSASSPWTEASMTVETYQRNCYESVCLFNFFSSSSLNVSSFHWKDSFRRCMIIITANSRELLSKNCMILRSIINLNN